MQRLRRVICPAAALWGIPTHYVHSRKPCSSANTSTTTGKSSPSTSSSPEKKKSWTKPTTTTGRKRRDNEKANISHSSPQQRAILDAEYNTLISSLQSPTTTTTTTTTNSTTPASAPPSLSPEELKSLNKYLTGPCALCGSPTSIFHVLNHCRVAVQDGRMLYRHNRVLIALVDGLLRELPLGSVAHLDVSDTAWNSREQLAGVDSQQQPEAQQQESQKEYLEHPNMRGNVKHLFNIFDLCDPHRPDCIVLEPCGTRCHMIELSIAFDSSEDTLSRPHERKRTKYAHLPTKLREEFRGGGNRLDVVNMFCVEVGSRGKMAATTLNIDKVLSDKEDDPKAQEGGRQIRHAMAKASLLSSIDVVKWRDTMKWKESGDGVTEKAVELARPMKGVCVGSVSTAEEGSRDRTHTDDDHDCSTSSSSVPCREEGRKLIVLQERANDVLSGQTTMKSLNRLKRNMFTAMRKKKN